MIKKITEILNSADKIDNWSINLVKINVTKKEGVKYYTPTDNGSESSFKKYLESLEKIK